jgi:hypothetical protein
LQRLYHLFLPSDLTSTCLVRFLISMDAQTNNNQSVAWGRPIDISRIIQGFSGNTSPSKAQFD